jgi:hypothetical protein
LKVQRDFREISYSQVFDLKIPEEFADEMLPTLQQNNSEKRSLFETTVDAEVLLSTLDYACLPLSPEVQISWQCNFDLYQMQIPKQLKHFTDFDITNLQKMYRLL